MKRPPIFIILFLCSFISVAQTIKKKLDVRVGFVGIQGFRSLTNVGDVNSVFSDATYPPLKSSISLSEAGVGIWLNHWYILAIGSNFQMSKSNLSNLTTSLTGEGFDLFVGYNLIQSKKIRLYPYVGVGDQSYVINIDPANPVAYINLLSNQNQVSIETTVSNEQTGSVGIGLDYIITPLFNNTADLSIALMSGYKYGAGGIWRVNNQLAVTPPTSLSGMDFRIAVQLRFKL